MSSWIQRLKRLRSDDRGTSLAELLVGMTVMGIFMTIFTVAVVGMARTTQKVEAVTTSAAQVNNAFLVLDKVVRYATAITTTGQDGSGNWYVELEGVKYDATAEVRQCTQLLLDRSNPTDIKLKLRTWAPVNATSYSLGSKSPWRTLASGVQQPAANPSPFSVPPNVAVASSSFQRLTVSLVAAGVGASASSTSTKVTFTAVNSRASDATNAGKCQQVGRTPS